MGVAKERRDGLPWSDHRPVGQWIGATSPSDSADQAFRIFSRSVRQHRCVESDREKIVFDVYKRRQIQTHRQTNRQTHIKSCKRNRSRSDSMRPNRKRPHVVTGCLRRGEAVVNVGRRRPYAVHRIVRIELVNGQRDAQGGIRLDRHRRVRTPIQTEKEDDDY